MYYRLVIFTLFTISCALFTELYAQAPAWQYVQKIGSDKRYYDINGDNHDMRVIAQMYDANNNHYVLLYINGDTFYYNGYAYKRSINPGCSGAALMKIRCNGTVAWSKIISNIDKSYSGYLNANLCFGKDENQILLGYTLGKNGKMHIDVDTTITAPNIYAYAYFYTTFFDSLGVYKKTMNKHIDSGFASTQGYIKSSNQYYSFRHIDSIFNPINYKGKILSSGDYLFLFDTNFNFNKIVQINHRKKTSEYITDSLQPFQLCIQTPIGYLSNLIVGNKLFFYTSLYFDRNDNGYNEKQVIVGKDTFIPPIVLNNTFLSLFFSYDDTGKHLFTKIGYAPKGRWNNPTSAQGQINDEWFKLGKDKNFYFNRNNGDTIVWGDVGSGPKDTIRSTITNGNHYLNYGSIDTNGILLWTNDLEHYSYVYGKTFHKMDVDPEGNMIIVQNMRRNYNFNGYAFKLDGKWYNNDTFQPAYNDYNTKPILMKLSRYKQELIAIGDNGKRQIDFDYLSVNNKGDIHLFGFKRTLGYLINNDSSDIVYQNLGEDFFMAKYGSVNCVCDTVTSSFLLIDTTQYSKITVQYNGTSTDSVLYIWGDGTQTYVKPATASYTKTYSGGTTFMIQCIAKNNCFQQSVSQFIYKLKCDTVKSHFTVLDSTQPSKISVVYSGTFTDSVLYVWGDGTRSLVKPTSTVQSKIYNKDTVLTIRAIVWNKCGTPDTFSRLVHIRCDTLINQFTILSSANKTVNVQYTGSTTDTVTYIWGDGTQTKMASPSTQITSHIYTTTVDSVKISSVIKNKCGKADTIFKWFVFCKPKTIVQYQFFCDSNIKIAKRIDTNLVFQMWSDGTTFNPKMITSSQKITGLYLQKNGCEYRDSFDIKKYSSPTLQKSTKYFNCTKTPISLNVSNADAMAYQWSNGLTGASQSVSTVGIFTVKISHPCGIFNDTFKIRDTGSTILDTIKKTSCNSYLWRDSMYSKTGKYMRKIVSPSGCDSIITLDLTIGINAKLTLSNGINYSTQDTYKTYQWYLCNPWKKISNQTSRYFSTTTKGSYCVIVSNGTCIDTSDCVALYSSGVFTTGNRDRIKIYPNPVHLSLSIEFGEVQKEIYVKIFDLSGRQLFTQSFTQTLVCDLKLESLAKGTYYLQVETDTETQFFNFLKE